jgi:hypothetical protein
MKSTAFKYGSLVIGIIAAVVIILSQSLSFKYSPKATEQKTPTEQSEDRSETAPGFGEQTISATSFPASAQINFIQQASCLFEVIFNNTISFPVDQTVDLPLNKFFSSVLGVLISPNAP